VTVQNAAGAPVDAEVRLIGDDELRLGSTGADGEAHAAAYPGDWQVVVSAAAFGARSVAAPISPGDGQVSFRVTLAAPLVSVTNGEFHLDGSFHFAFDSATIEADSRSLLEELAAALQLHPEITRVEIQGHTDDKGDPVYNLDLSQRRADAVRGALVAAGVAPGRLVARGYGATSPIEPNTTEAGRRANRRVHLLTLAKE
jgi:outer membrane protein OmpA-like peptidoglycan-associated protein